MANASSIKVSVNGRKYQISGITKQTSCKDLLCALAKTTSSERQLDLFEKWKDCERRLPVNSEPLGLLDYWGAESAKVKFIARERGVEIETVAKDKSTRQHRSHHQRQKTEKTHRKKRTSKMPSLDDTVIEDRHRQRRSHRRSRRKHYEDSDVDTYSDVLRSVISQAKELKSQVRDIHKSDQSQFELMDYYTKPLAKTCKKDRVKASNSCSVDNDTDSGVPSIGDESSQDSISRDENESNMSDTEEGRQRIDSGLASELSADLPEESLATVLPYNSCIYNTDTKSLATPYNSNNNNNHTEDYPIVSESDEENLQRKSLWRDYQKLCIQLCEVNEQLEITKLTCDTSLAELACLDAVQLLGGNETDDKHESERLEKEVEVTRSLIDSVQNLTMYQLKEINANSNEIDQRESDLKSRTILYESLSKELDCLQLSTAPRRLIKRSKCNTKDLNKAKNSIKDGISLV